MKVLHVIPSVGPLRGGPSFVIRAMSKGLLLNGCEVHIATTDDNGAERLRVPFDHAVIEDGVTCWYFPRQTQFYIFSWPFAKWLARHVADYDLVHIHTLFSFAVIPAAYWAARHGVPYVIRPLGVLNRWGFENRRPWLKRASFRLIERRVLRGASAIHYTSEEEREEAADVAPAQNAVVIPNPVDFRLERGAGAAGRLRADYPELAGKRTILFLSRLHPKKGLDLLLTAFARLRTRLPDVALVIGGDGEESFVRSLHKIARDVGIESDVVWTGFLEGSRKRAILAGADVFVLPSYSENFGVAVVEAMAAGLPVVVSDHVGLHREITSARAGLVVSCNEERLADALSRLLEDAPLRAEVVRSGKRLAESFSTATVGSQLMELYHKLAQHADAPSTVRHQI